MRSSVSESSLVGPKSEVSLMPRLLLDAQALDWLRYASSRGRWPMPPLDGAWLTYRIVEIRHGA